MRSSQQLWACARLNRRALILALRGHWLKPDHFAAGYDRVAPSYDDAWQRHLRPVTDRLLAHLPKAIAGPVIDLGCGTGYTTRSLAAMFAGSAITAVDLSPGMLAAARAAANGSVTWRQADMLRFLREQPRESAGLILSAWAIGYSQPKRLMREAGRVLAPGGTLAFVVNFRDTLAPVFGAFRRCLFRFPEKMQRAVVFHFPRDGTSLRAALTAADFSILWDEEGRQSVTPPTELSAHPLAWLLKTGVLAGFEEVLPLRHDAQITEHFEELLKKDTRRLEHHYISIVAQRS